MPKEIKDQGRAGSSNDVDPVRLRAIFGENLRVLSADAPSIAGLCRDLKINRTQFNKYLNGQSFPRPDVLHQICTFFDVDARILLEPLDQIYNRQGGLIGKGRTRDDDGSPSSGGMVTDISRLPFGPSLVYRRSVISKDEFTVSLAITKLNADNTLSFDSIMPRAIARYLGLSTSLTSRRIKGEMFQHPTGISYSHKLNHIAMWQHGFLEHCYMGNPNFYAGECLNTFRFRIPGNISDKVFLERIEPTRSAMFAAGRQTGLVKRQDLKPIVREYFETPKNNIPSA